MAVPAPIDRRRYELLLDLLSDLIVQDLSAEATDHSESSEPTDSPKDTAVIVTAADAGGGA